MKLWETKLLPYLEDNTISEIQANGGGSLFVRRGKRLEIGNVFESEREYWETIESLIQEINPNLTELPSYLEEGRLTYGDGRIARVHIILPPISYSPQLTIAKKTASLTTIEDIYHAGSISQKTKNFIKAAIDCKLNIVFSGSTGSGKALVDTTLIPTPTGLKQMKNLKVGDYVFAPNGKPTKIKRVYFPEVTKAYSLKFNNHEEIIACADHNWYVINRFKTHQTFSVKTFKNRRKEHLKNLRLTLTQNDYSTLFLDYCKNTLKLTKPCNWKAIERLFPDIDFTKEYSAHFIANSILEKLTAPVSYITEKLTTQEIYDSGLRRNGRHKFGIKNQGVLEYPSSKLPIHPYLFGVWLGDGYSGAGKLIGNKDRLDNMIKYIEQLGYEARLLSPYKNKPKVAIYSIWEGKSTIMSTLRALRVLNNKHIPDEYIYNSIENRVNLIAGLIDTDGWVDSRGLFWLSLTNRTIIEKVREVVYSLGYRPSKITTKRPKAYLPDGRTLEGKESYSFNFLDADNLIPLQNLYKKERQEIFRKKVTKRSTSNLISIVGVEPFEITNEKFMCFEVEDESHQFLASENYIPTGNTTFLEACTKLIQPDARIGVIEDSPELSLIQPNVTYLHSHLWKPKMKQEDVASLEFCVRQINRMRTDIIIVGETRGAEFKGWLTGANSGMDGSMTTIHSNDTKSALHKMTSFVMEATPQPIRAINGVIARTVDIVVQLSKTVEGKYRLQEISEVIPMLGNDENAEIATTPLTVYDKNTDRWSDTFLLSDRLRKKLTEKGYEIQEFTKKANFKSGLPKLS